MENDKNLSSEASTERCEEDESEKRDFEESSLETDDFGGDGPEKDAPDTDDSVDDDFNREDPADGDFDGGGFGENDPADEEFDREDFDDDDFDLNEFEENDSGDSSLEERGFDEDPYDDADYEDFAASDYEEDADLTASRAAADAARMRSSKSRRRRARRVLLQRVGIGAVIAAVILLIAVYIFGCVYFSSHFMFHTTLNGTEVSLLNEEEVEEALLSAADDYVLTIEGREGVTDTIEGAAVSLEPVFDGSIGTLIAQQSVFSWPMTLFTQTDLISGSTASFDGTALSRIIAGLSFFDEENVSAPVNATYAWGENGLEIVPEDSGSTPDTEGLTAAIVTALNGFASVLTLDDSCYVAPDITSESEELLDTIAALNDLMDTAVTLIFDENASGTLEGGSVLTMLVASDGTAVVNASEEDDLAGDAVLLTAASVTGYVEAQVLIPDDEEEEDSDSEDGNEDDSEEEDSDSESESSESESDDPDGEEAEDDTDSEEAKVIATDAQEDSEDAADAQITAAEEDSAGSDDTASISLDLSGVLGTSFTFSEERVSAYVDALADLYDTYGNDIVFHTTSGRNVEVPGGNYGWLMDRDATAAALLSQLNSKEGGELEIVWTQTAEQFGSDDIGDTYAEVDLDEQKVYLYVDGELVLETDCVSGKASDYSRYTPDGVFRITYRKSPATLTGTDYVSYVTYWMPFNQGIGFHDATWRSSFGGSIYISSGSHGCINLPYDAAETLYGYVYSGMPVIVFGGVVPEKTETTTTTATSDVEEEGSATEQESTEATIIAQAIANYVATGMTEAEATAQVEADLAAQLAEQQAAAEAAAAAAAQAAAQTTE